MQSLGTWAVVDEESMSTEPNAAILAIGATMIDDLEAVDRFYVNVDLQSCLAVGLHESESTRNWWAKQSAEAFNATQTNCVPIQTALQMWTDWINKHGGKSVRLMGNGPCADNMWLNSAYKACGMENPVPFWNDICHRTLNWIGGKWLGVTKEDVPFKGVKHHAGDDAEHEAQHAVMVLNVIQDALVYKELNQGAKSAPTTEKGAATAMTTSKQEFILNNITEMVRAGRVEGLPKLAADLAEVYDHALDLVRIESTHNVQCHVEVNNNVPDPAPVQKPQPHYADYVEPSDAPSIPREATESTPVAEEIPSAPVAEPTPPAERTHDDWNLPYSEEWHVSTRNTAKLGYFKRKPGTNEEEYAKYMQQCVIEAGDTFTGPDNWASLARIAKYLDPVVAAPTSPQVTATETLQPQAETVGQAMHTGAVAEAPTSPTPSVEAIHAPVPTAPTAAPVGASAASEIPTPQVMMQAHMKVCQGFGVSDPRSKAVLESLGVANFMVIGDDKKAWFVKACEAVVDQLDVIKTDASGEMLKTVLDSVTA